MNPATECRFEDEVLAAAMQSRWPDRVPAELREHVTHCEVCRDLAQVASCITEARDDDRTEVALPEAGRIWWKTQMRARREAIEAAGRPITAIHVAAFACTAGIVGACFGATSAWFQSVLRVLGSGLVPQFWSVIAAHGSLVLLALLMFLVLPAALYLAIGRE